MNTFKLFTVILAVCLSFICVGAAAEEDKNEIEEEIERQIDSLDVSSWDEYFESIGSIVGSDVASFDELILRYADDGYAKETGSLFGTAVNILGQELKKSLGAAALLTASALLTSLSGLAADEGLKKVLSAVLCMTALSSVVAMLASVTGTAYRAIDETGILTERSLPIMSALMVSSGSETSAGILRPMFLFLSETVIMLVERIVLPLVVAQGALSSVAVLTDGEWLDGFHKLINKAVKWILGAISVFYFGVTAVQGLTAASRDGITLRTAKYALDKLVPAVGGMVSGTVDSVIGCALLLRNGVGTAAILILFSKIFRPLIILFSGMFIFRISEAVCAPAADRRAVKLLSNAADTVSNLFACTAATGAMFFLTMLVLMTSGGVAAGLW